MRRRWLLHGRASRGRLPAMAKKNPAVDAFIARQTRWQAEMKKLRPVLLGSGLAEELKWGKPCYTHDGSNVAIIQPFKGCCALMFFKGSLLKDPGKHLVRQGKNSQAAMRVELTSVAQVRELEPAIRALVDQAIAVEKAGLKVDFGAKHELELPDELKLRLASDAKLAAAFDGLTPGRRRAYVMHFADAKQSKTRAARIERCVERILAGKGLNDR